MTHKKLSFFKLKYYCRWLQIIKIAVTCDWISLASGYAVHNYLVPSTIKYILYYMFINSDSYQNIL